MPSSDYAALSSSPLGPDLLRTLPIMKARRKGPAKNGTTQLVANSGWECSRRSILYSLLLEFHKVGTLYYWVGLRFLYGYVMGSIPD